MSAKGGALGYDGLGAGPAPGILVLQLRTISPGFAVVNASRGGLRHSSSRRDEMFIGPRHSQ